jgi:hypothetical protein
VRRVCSGVLENLAILFAAFEHGTEGFGNFRALENLMLSSRALIQNLNFMINAFFLHASGFCDMHLCS